MSLVSDRQNREKLKADIAKMASMKRNLMGKLKQKRNEKKSISQEKDS